MQFEEILESLKIKERGFMIQAIQWWDNSPTEVQRRNPKIPFRAHIFCTPTTPNQKAYCYYNAWFMLGPSPSHGKWELVSTLYRAAPIGGSHCNIFCGKDRTAHTKLHFYYLQKRIPMPWQLLWFSSFD